MFKKLLLALAALIATTSIAFAAVEVNTADQAALDGVRGLGPATSKAILEERKKGGEFKDWADLEKRVKGIKDKRAEGLSKAGLTVNGKAKSGAAASASASGKSDAKKDDKDMKGNKDSKDNKDTKGGKESKDKKSSASASAPASASASASKPESTKK